MNRSSSSCLDDIRGKEIEEWEFNWLTIPDGEYDLRKAFIYCDEKTNKWTPRNEWSKCDKDYYISPITNYTACYSTEALKYA